MKTGRFHLVTKVASCVARREMSILDHWRKTMRPARVSEEAVEGLGLASKADGSEDASCALDMAYDDAGNQRLQAADAITALMAEMQLVSRHVEYHWIRNAPRCRYYPNRLNRQFDAIAPNTVWTADLTYIRVGYEWRYFFAIVDLCKRRVIGWGAVRLQDKRIHLCCHQAGFS